MRRRTIFWDKICADPSQKMMGLFQHTRISEINEFISALRLLDKRAGVRNLAEFVDGAWVGSESISIYAEGHPLRTCGPG